MPIGIHVRYKEGQFRQLGAKLSAFERGQVQHQSIAEAGAFLLEKVREYPPYRYVSRRSAYGTPFFSDKQRRWFFWALGEGLLSLPYTRTNALREAWRVEPLGGDMALSVVNEAYAAPYVMGTSTQSRMSKKIGWRTVGSFVHQYRGELGRIALKVIKAKL